MSGHGAGPAGGRDGAQDHREWEETLAAYALGGLDEREVAAFEVHLDGCEDCRGELRWLTPAVDALPAAVEQLEPPPSLRRDLLATVRAEAPAHSGRQHGRSWFGWLKGGMSRPTTVALATAVIAVAVVGGYLLRGDEQAGPTSVTVPVEATVPQMQASADLVGRGDSWTLNVDRLPRLRGGDVYQVWVRSGRDLRPSTVFVLDHDGDATVAVPQRLGGGDEVMVTREPRGGSPAPTSAPLLQARV